MSFKKLLILTDQAAVNITTYLGFPVKSETLQVLARENQPRLVRYLLKARLSCLDYLMPEHFQKHTNHIDLHLDRSPSHEPSGAGEQ